MTATSPGAGDLALTLGGEEIVLKCTPAAALALCRAPGGIYGIAGQPGVTDRLLACDIDTMAFVIRAGLGLTGSAVKGLEESIWNYGLLAMRTQLSGFIGTLANGGKPINAAESGDAGPGEGAAPEGGA